MVKRIVDDHVDADETKSVRPDFFRELPIKLTGGDLPWQWEEDGMTVTRSAAWSAPGCHDGCGVLVYTDKDGKFVKVEGDRDNPYTQGRLCPRCIDLAEVMFHPDRLLYPAIRDKADRGNPDAWKRVTWDEAYDLIYDRLEEIKQKYGAKTVLFAAGTGRVTPPIAARLGYAYGSIQYSYFLSGNACYVPRVAACNTIMGAYSCPDHSQYFIDRYDHEGWVPSKNIFVWGNNPLVANADGNIGHWIVDCMQRGSRLIVVDPRLTWLASKAYLWLQLRPGTDAALALAMGKYIIEEDLYDHEFVENWCYGFNEYYEACKPYDLQTAAEITWLDPEDIVLAAKLMAEKPTSVQWGLAIDMTEECTANAQSVVNLWSITGQIDIPGGMYTTHQPFNTISWLPPDPKEIFTPQQEMERIGSSYQMITNSGMVQCQADTMIDQLNTGRPFKIHGAIIQSTNPLPCTGQEPKNRIEPGLLNNDFNVGIDCFMTPTIQACCDVILPLCFYPERDGLRTIHYYIQDTVKCCIPQGESKDDFQISWELGRRWNKDLWPGETLEEFFDWLLTEADMSYEDVKHENWVYPEYHYEKFRKGEQRPDGELGFNTPTGRIELYSTLLASWGVSPVPKFVEPPTSPVSRPDLVEKYPFILTSGARHYASFHSEHRQIPRLRALHPNPWFEIHPKKAAELGIHEGDWCYVESPKGKCKLVAHVTPAILEDVIMADHGWWFPERDAADHGEGCYGTYDSNINEALPAGCGHAGFGNNCKCYMCNVYKVPDDEDGDFRRPVKLVINDNVYLEGKE